MPFLKLVGGLLLLWIAVKLIVPSDEHGEDSVKAGDTLLARGVDRDRRRHRDEPRQRHRDRGGGRDGAARVDLAHALAIKTTLIVFGLATSVPLIIAGSALLMALLDRFPILVWAGAALLGWVAGEIMVKDAAWSAGSARSWSTQLHLWAAAAARCSWSRSAGSSGASKHKSALEQPADRRSAGAGGVSAEVARE